MDFSSKILYILIELLNQADVFDFVIILFCFMNSVRFKELFGKSIVPGLRLSRQQSIYEEQMRKNFRMVSQYDDSYSIIIRKV